MVPLDEGLRRLASALAGSAAVEPVKDFVRRQESGVAWGLRVLSALVPAEELLAVALELLKKPGGEYTRDPEKKLTLRTWLQPIRRARDSRWPWRTGAWRTSPPSWGTARPR